jgi:hypothetical protein
VTPLLIALLLVPGTIRASVADGEATFVLLREGVVWREARGAQAVFSGLAPGAYEIYARAEGAISPLLRDLRPGCDVRLELRPARRVRVVTEPGARAVANGIAFGPHEVEAPEGLATLVVDHPERVSSAARLLRSPQGPEVVAVPLDGGLVVAGSVVDARGEPVDGARVETYADGLAVGRGAATDSTGGFGVGGFLGDAVSVRVRALFHADAMRRVLFPPGAERARVDVALRPASACVVFVLDARGRPARDAEAVLVPRWYDEAAERAVARANLLPERRRGGPGFRFAHLSPGEEYRVVLTRPGGLVRSTPFFRAPPAGRTLDLGRVSVPKGATLRGRVLGAAAPAPLVECRAPDGVRLCRADREGRFSFAGLPEGEARVVVRDADETERVVALRAGDATELEVEVGKVARSVRGIVFDADGKPLPGVVVESAGARATSDERGVFELAGLPAGRATFAVALAPGPRCRALAEDPHLPAVEPRVAAGAELRVRLERAGRLVVRLDGPAPARATLHLRGTSGAALARRVPRGAREIAIEDLPVGAYVADVVAPGVVGSAGAVVPVPTPPDHPPLPLAAGRTASGVVLVQRAKTRPGVAPEVEETPPPLAWVVLVGADPRRRGAWAPVDEEGRFALSGLPAEPVLLAASGPGHPPALLRVDLAERDAPDLRFVLHEAASAEVVVVDGLGREVEGVEARLFRDDGIATFDLLGRARFLGAVGDDADPPDLLAAVPEIDGGRVRFGFLAPGSYRCRVTAPGFRPAAAGLRAVSPVSAREIADILEGAPVDLAARIVLEPESAPR